MKNYLKSAFFIFVGTLSIGISWKMVVDYGDVALLLLAIFISICFVIAIVTMALRARTKIADNAREDALRLIRQGINIAGDIHAAENAAIAKMLEHMVSTMNGVNRADATQFKGLADVMTDAMKAAGKHGLPAGQPPMMLPDFGSPASGFTITGLNDYEVMDAGDLPPGFAED